MAYDFKIVNNCFKKWEKHLITYKNGVTISQIDIFLVQSIDKKTYEDCKVILSESLITQHMDFVLDVHVKSQKQQT